MWLPCRTLFEYQVGGASASTQVRGDRGGPPYISEESRMQPNPYPYQDPSYQQAPRNQRQSHTTKYIVAKVIDYITWAILVLEAIFLLRFFLKLLGADPNNQFAQFLYNLTGFFLFPFAGIVQSGKFGTTVVHIFEWSKLIGMLV